MIDLLIQSTLRLSTPLIFAALGGLLCERAGVINIALEGMMLVGALGAAIGTLWTGSPWAGFACGALLGMILAAFYALCVIWLRANQIVAGTAINLLALGLTPFTCKVLYDVTGSTPAIPIESRFVSAPLFICGLAIFGGWFLFKHTRTGLRLWFAGEAPAALDAAGIRVNRLRALAVIAGGALAGMGGACLSIWLSSSFSRNMTAGRGFMALAALIFGKWKPVPAAAACVLFGAAEAAQILLQGTTIAGVAAPAQLIQILPYVVTMLVLAGFLGRSRPPKALGTIFRKS